MTDSPGDTTAAMYNSSGDQAHQVDTGKFDRATILMLLIVMLAAFVQLIDVSIVNVAIPSIQTELHATSAQIQLVVAGYLLAFAMMLITGARLGDIYGRKRMFIIGMCGFTVASAACGAAPTATFLVVARVIQGAFSALMFPQVLSVIQVNVPPRERGRAFGIFGAVIGLATILGPLVGGALIALNIGGIGWRAIFYVNLPIGIVAVFGAMRRLPESKAPDAPTLDVPGAILATVGVFLLVFPLIQGRQDGWPLWGWIMLASAVPVFGVFAIYERGRSQQDRFPIVHASLLKDRAFVAGMVFQIVFFAGLGCFFFVMSLYLQDGFGFSALQAGLTTFPFAVGTAVGSIISNKLTERLGTRILTVGVGIVFFGMGLTLLLVHGVGTGLHGWELSPVLVVTGFGMGLVIPPVINIVLAGIHAKAAGSASGVLSTTQQLGSTFGIALIGVVFFTALAHNAPVAAATTSTQLRVELTHAGLPPSAINGIVAGFDQCFDDRMSSSDPSIAPPSCAAIQQQIATSPASAPVKAQVQRAIVDSAQPLATRSNFRRAFELSLVYELIVYALAFALTFTIPRMKRGGGGHGGPPDEAEQPVPAASVSA